MDDFISLLPSRQRRSLTRGMNIQHIKLMEKIISSKGTKRPVKTHCRDFIILPELIGATVQVYNGRDFLPVEVVGEMLGHVLGEFSLTRGKISHSKAGVGATKGSKHKAKK